jgi:uncharacterized protein
MENDNNQSNNRRNFLKKGLIGAASLSVLPSVKGWSQESKNVNQEKKEGKIIYRTLGRTGLKIPIVSMGTSNNEYIIKAAMEAGIVHFDTGNTYGNGVDEATFGRIFKDKPRDSFIIGTKIVGMRDNGSGMPSKNVTAAEFVADFKKKFESSLKRLKVDYVDILYLHSADVPEVVKVDYIKDVMQEIKNSGKAKFLGVSTHNHPSVYATADEKIYDVVLLTYNFRDANDSGKKAIDYAAKAGLGILGMKALAGVYWDNERKHLINATAASKWVLNNENMHTLLLTINTFEQLDKYMALMNDITLTPGEKEDLKLGQVIGSNGIYCVNCENCLKQCPYGVDVPKIMRSYMYAYGYQKPSMAKENLKLLSEQSIMCDKCTSCDINCTMGFDIRKKVLDISRVLNMPDEFLV